MASTTIHTLSYKMIADTKNFSKGVLATKSEVQLLKKIMGDTTPEQKAEKAIQRINSLFDKGKITAKQQAEALKAVKHEMVAAERAASKFWQTTDKLKAGMLKIGKIGIGAAAAGVGILGYNVKAEIENMKAISDQAEDLQMNFNDLVKLQQAFIRGGEVSGDVVVPALRLMNENIQMASRDMGRFKQLAGELGLEMDTMNALAKMPVLEQFRVVVDQISKLPDQGSKGLIVKKLFGTDENKLTTLLGGGLDNLDKIAATAEQFGMTLKDDSVQSIRELVGQTEQLADTWTGLMRQLSVELTPILGEIVKTLQMLNGNRVAPVKLKGDAGLINLAGQVTKMAATEQRGMVQFSDNRGTFVREMRGRLNEMQLLDFFQQARQLDPNFNEFSLSPSQRTALNRSALKGNPGGTQEQVQLAILEELRKQVAASQELVRKAEDKENQQRSTLD